MAAYANTEVKQPVVAEIAELLNGAQAAVLADYRGLTVEQDTALRKQLREAGVVYKVYKNTCYRTFDFCFQVSNNALLSL